MIATARSNEGGTASDVGHPAASATDHQEAPLAQTDDTSAIKIKRKGRFTVKTTVADNVSGHHQMTTPKAKETMIHNNTTSTGKTKLRPCSNLFSPDGTPDDDNYDAFGLNLVAAPKEETEGAITEVTLRPLSLKKMKSNESYISDDSSSASYQLDLDDKPEASYDLIYSPERVQLNHSSDKQSHVTFNEKAVDVASAAAANNSGSDESVVPLVIGRHSTESPNNSDSVSSRCAGSTQPHLNSPKPKDQFDLLPLPQHAQRSSSLEVSSNLPRPKLQMRYRSEPFFSSKSERWDSKNNVAGEYDRKYSTTCSSECSLSVAGELLLAGTPLSLPEGDMMPSGRITPIHSNLDTLTPTQTGEAKLFYANQHSAQKVAELQATVQLARRPHRPYLDFEERDTLNLPQSFSYPNSQTNTPISTVLCYTQTEEDSQDHNYWKSKAAPCGQLVLVGPNELHPSRWSMLFYMSLLNLLSGWICFSVAPVAIIMGEDIAVESLVSLFLIASAVATFWAPVTLSRLGLRRTVLLGALLLVVSLKVCCASPDFVERRELLHVGFMIAGLSQPLYQITPIFVLTAWFPHYEHMTMLRIVLKSNQLGVMFSFIFGPFLVSSDDDILPYFQSISLITTILFIAVAFHFEEVPPVPPTRKAFQEFKPMLRYQPLHEDNNGYLTLKDTNTNSNLDIIFGNHTVAKMDFVEAYTEQLKEGRGHRNNFSYGTLDPSSPFPNLQGIFTPRENMVQQPGVGLHQDVQTRSQETTICNNHVLSSMKTCFSKEDFTRCSIAFATSGVVANSLVTFMIYIIGVSQSSRIEVGAIGCAFQLLVMTSPIVVDRWTDPSNRQRLILASLLAGAVGLVLCNISLGMKSFAGLVSSLLVVALLVGSSQSLSIGRGIEISQMSENSVLTIFRLISNTLSAAAIPLFRLLQPASIAASAPEFSLSFIMLIAVNMIAAATCFYGSHKSNSAIVQR